MPTPGAPKAYSGQALGPHPPRGWQVVSGWWGSLLAGPRVNNERGFSRGFPTQHPWIPTRRLDTAACPRLRVSRSGAPHLPGARGHALLPTHSPWMCLCFVLIGRQ